MVNFKRILVVRTDRLGDVILSTPVIKNLRSAFPKAFIAFVCRPYTRDVLEGNPGLDEVIVYDKYGKHKGFWSSIKFALYLRRKKFDLALILHPTNRVHMITFLAGIPERVGWDRKLSWLLTRRVRHQKQEGKKHELEYTLDLLRELNIPVIHFDTYFPLISEAETAVDNLLKNKGLTDGDKFIVIHPSASCRSKRWPQERFQRVVELLRLRTGLRVIVVTSSSEKGFGEGLIGDSGVIDLRGSLTIPELGALLKRASLFVSNDSGPVHIAANFNTPVISIFGRNDPGLSPLRWGPKGNQSFYFHAAAGCSECLAHNCIKGFLCLRKITPEEVADKAIELLSG